MSTILYPSPVFGPVKSRRLGISLGINLMPPDGKVCTFDCIYCECGFNNIFRPSKPRPTRKEVAEKLEEKLQHMTEEGLQPDVITFAGNGEPTAHPHFADIIDDTLHLRDRYCPKAKVSVLSNATQLHRPDVVEALLHIDNNIQKLDTVNPIFINKVDRPTGHYDVDKIISQLKAFEGKVIIQTMFLHGPQLNNTTPEYVEPWLKTVADIKPQQVMVYTVDRETPDPTLSKATHEELDTIRDRVIALGIDCTASY